MIAWWIIPTILTALSFVSFLWTVTRRDIFIAGMWFGLTFGLCGATAFVWILCLILKAINA